MVTPALLRMNWRETGIGLFLIGGVWRAVERHLFVVDIRERFLGLAWESLPAFNTAIELWPGVWSEVFLSLTVGLSLASFFHRRRRAEWLLLLLVVTVFCKQGARGISPSTLVLIPGYLALAIEEIARRRGMSPRHAVMFPVILLAALYGFNGLAKLSGDKWLAGEGIAIFLTSNVWSIGVAPFASPWWLKGMTWIFLAWEVSGLLLAFWRPLWRPYAAVAILFHLSLCFLSPFKSLGLACVGLWVMVLGSPSANFSAPEKWTRRGLTAVVVWGLWFVLNNTPNYGLPGFTGKLASLHWHAGLQVSFRLFAPNPYGAGRMVAKLRNDREKEETYSEGTRLNFLLDLNVNPFLRERVFQLECQRTKAQQVGLDLWRDWNELRSSHALRCP